MLLVKEEARLCRRLDFPVFAMPLSLVMGMAPGTAMLDEGVPAMSSASSTGTSKPPVAASDVATGVFGSWSGWVKEEASEAEHGTLSADNGVRSREVGSRCASMAAAGSCRCSLWVYISSAIAVAVVMAGWTMVITPDGLDVGRRLDWEKTGNCTSYLVDV